MRGEGEVTREEEGRRRRSREDDERRHGAEGMTSCKIVPPLSGAYTKSRITVGSMHIEVGGATSSRTQGGWLGVHSLTNRNTRGRLGSNRTATFCARMRFMRIHTSLVPA